MGLRDKKDGSVSLYKTVTAGIVNTSFKQALSRYETVCINNANLQIKRERDIVSDCINFIATYFSAGTQPRQISIHLQWPKNWVEAVKERWFPKWWLRRWPVEYERYDREETIYMRICPHMNIPLEKPHLEWLLQEDE